MSDMEQSDLAPAPTASELQAEIDELKAEMAAKAVQPEAQPEPAPAVPVAVRTPSSAAPAPEPVPVTVAPVSLEEAAASLVSLVRQHRTVGDSDVDTALAAVESALA